MPYASRRQARWAHATRQPFARRWDKETPSFAALPERKDAGADVGAPLHGPGGLLGTPGLGIRKWGKRRPRVTTKPMTRSEAARAAALARWGKYTPKPDAPKPAKTARGRGGRAAAQTTPEQRATARQVAQQAKRDERQRERQTEREAARRQVYERMGIPPEARAALEALRRGEQPDPAVISGFVDAGLVERATDGSYRMTPSGRALTAAADAGDAGRAGDTISSSRDRLGQRRARQAEQARRRQEAQERRAARGSGGGGGKKKKQPQERPISLARRRRLARAQQRIADAVRRVQQRTKAQTAEDRAMFAKMGRGGAGGGGGLWSRGPEGTRQPTRAQAEAHHTRAYNRASGDARRAEQDARQLQDKYRQSIRRAQSTKPDSPAEQRALDAKDRVGARFDKAKKRRDRAVETQHRLHMRGLRDYNIQEAKSFTVFKDYTGTYRWLARSTTAYRDRDGEIITTKALEADAARMQATGQYGPLRWWHCGLPDPFNPAAPWGQGLDIGDCDYSVVIGRTSIESGTFKSAELAEVFAQSADDYELSPGFFHPPDQPNAAGEYDTIRRFERSPVPVKYGRASNLFTGLTVKEARMDPHVYEQRVKAFIAEMHAKGAPPEAVAATLASMERADKSAQAQGIAYKSDDAPQVYTAPDGTPGMIVDGRFVALKAAAPPEMEVVEEQADDMGDGMEEGSGGEFVGDMTPAEFWAQLQQYLAPVLKTQDMVKAITDMGGELKSMYATKDAGTLARIQQLEVELAKLKGDQPAVATNDALAALKSDGPQAPPDPNAVQIPADASPVQRLAMQTMPNLYATNPQGGFAGWTPPQPP